MPTISNTSPLIWLAKVGKLYLLKNLFGEVIITQQSYREAVEDGLKAGFNDALVIKNAYEQGWIKVSVLSEGQAAVCRGIMQQSSELHEGEVYAIVFAREFGGDALLLMDDSCGRAFAETWGLEVRGVLYVVIEALRKGLLTDAQAKEAVLLLVQRGFRIEPKLLARVLSELER